MTDEAILAFNTERSYDTCMRPALRDGLLRRGTTLCADFFITDEYRERYELVKQRLGQMRDDFRSITWCIENDYPAYGAGVLLAEQAVALDAPLCLDVSHLWIACLLFERDYLQQVAMIAETGRVRCVHLHANATSADAAIADYRDGHRPLTHCSAIDLPRLIDTLASYAVNHWVIETSRAGVADLQALNDWLA